MPDSERPSQEPNESPRRTWFSEGVLLGIFTAAAYLSAYLYNAGACSYYGIPRELITLSVTDLLVALSSLAIVVTAILLVINFLPPLLSPPWSPLFRALLPLIPLASMMLAFLILFGLRSPEFIGTGAAVSLFLIGEFLPVIAFDRDKQFDTKLAQKLQEDARSPTLIRILGRRFGVIAPMSLWLMSIVAVGFPSVGKAVAMFRREYLVVAGPSPLAVLQIYGGVAVVAPLDRANKSFRPEFKVRPLVELPTMTVENVGPLARAQPTATPATTPPADTKQ